MNIHPLMILHLVMIALLAMVVFLLGALLVLPTTCQIDIGGTSQTCHQQF